MYWFQIFNISAQVNHYLIHLHRKLHWIFNQKFEKFKYIQVLLCFLKIKFWSPLHQHIRGSIHELNSSSNYCNMYLYIRAEVTIMREIRPITDSLHQTQCDDRCCPTCQSCYCCCSAFCPVYCCFLKGFSHLI